jgi:hypothetical protein
MAFADLPEDDRPEGGGLVPVPDRELPPGEDWPAPVQLVAALLVFLNGDYQVDLLRAMVTPDSYGSWVAELPAIRRRVAGLSLATGVEYPANDIAYVRLIADLDADSSYQVDADVMVSAVIVTLQRIPVFGETLAGGWMAYGIGDYVRPEDMPPSAKRLSQEEYIRSRWHGAEEALDDVYEAVSTWRETWTQDLERAAMPTGRALLACMEALINLDDIARKEGADLMAALRDASSYDDTALKVASVLEGLREQGGHRCEDPECRDDHPL